MKKPILTVVVASIGLVLLCGATSVSITPQGTVSSVIEISVAPIAGYNTLDLAVNATDVDIANITERANSKNGYTVTLASANAGSTSTPKFAGATAGNTDVLPYSIKYNGTTVSLSSGEAIVTDASAKTSGTGVTKLLEISYLGASSFLNADSYSDTLTLTIAAK